MREYGRYEACIWPRLQVSHARTLSCASGVTTYMLQLYTPPSRLPSVSFSTVWVKCAVLPLFTRLSTTGFAHRLAGVVTARLLDDISCLDCFSSMKMIPDATYLNEAVRLVLLVKLGAEAFLVSHILPTSGYGQARNIPVGVKLYPLFWQLHLPFSSVMTRHMFLVGVVPKGI